MNIFLYLPIAEVSVNIFALLGMGLTIGFLSGLFGVGGGFLLTPALMMLGIPPTIAAASDSNQIVAATTSATYAHWRLGNVDVKMGFLLLSGGLCGGSLGVEIIKLLRQIGNADFLIKICYVVMLGIVGFYMFQESLRSLRRPAIGPSDLGAERPESAPGLLLALPWKTHFAMSGVTISVLVPIMVGFLVGMLAAIMGVGGGFIMVPALVYILRMPVHVVIGTNLFQEIFLCMSITFMQAELNHTVDFVLALVLLL
ncbi:MAG: sulfite exporter TauE/SafE family protein, partial [Acidobacteriota bacterium]